MIHAGGGGKGGPAASQRAGAPSSRRRANIAATRPPLRRKPARETNIAAAVAGATPARRRPPVVIIGGGLAGLSAAVALRRSGVEDVIVLESAPGPRTEGGGLSLWANAWRALDALGPEVAAEVRAAAGPPLRALEFCSSGGRVLKRFTVREATREPGDAEEEGAISDEFRGVRRAELLAALLGALPEGTVRYGVRGQVVAVAAAAAAAEADGAAAGAAAAGAGPGGTPAVEPPLPRVRLVPTTSAAASAAGNKEQEAVIEARCVVGADSARSGVATDFLALPKPRYNGYVAWRGVARGPPSAGDGGASGDIPPVRLVLGAGVRAGVYPLGRGETYWFVTRNAPEGEAPSARGDQAALRAQALDAVSGWGWRGMRELVEATPLEGLSRARIGDRWTFPRAWGGGGGGEGDEGGDGGDGGDGGGGIGRGRVTLCGDAQHPMSPNLGQGGCTALEDAPVLAAALARAFEIEEEEEAAGGGRRGGDVVARALRAYERERLARTLPLTLRSAAVGFALQLPYPPVVAMRDAVIERVFSPRGFLEHTRYDCRAAAAALARAVR